MTADTVGAPVAGPRRGRAGTLRGRPDLYTDYASDQAPLPTATRRAWVTVLLLALVLAPLQLEASWEATLTRVFVYAIGGIGLNIVTGYAGQVSLGHAFFLGLGAYTAAFFGAQGTAQLRGLGLGMEVWLPLAGLVPALVGFLVAPIAMRVRGLYLAIVTLALVFIGEHVFREARTFTGGLGVGRDAAPPVLFGVDFFGAQQIGPVRVDGVTMFYLLCLALLTLLAIASKNLTRSKVGRAFAAVRDRDIAAEVMGVSLLRTKVIAFTVSSFYAGICGALLAVANGGRTEPSFYSLFLSVDFLAVILIGGVATLSGSLLGAAFVILLPRFTQLLPRFIPFIEGGAQGGFLTVFQVEAILFGVLIVVFLIAEPRGLYGLWVRTRNYWKAWPFSY